MALLLLPAAPGCDDGKPYVDTSMTEATVSGIVKVRGKPAEGGTILFNASNSGRIVPHRTATIGKDGSYTLKTYTGPNQVSFEGELAQKDREIGLVKEFADVKSGNNAADFDLLGEGGNKKLPFPVPVKGKSRGKPGP
jgi:hypothetical protein